VYKVLAWIVLVGGIIASLVTASLTSQFNGALGFFTMLINLVVVAIAFIGIYAFSELIELFIAIEENTRKP
jgi:amino acid transporter